MHSDGVWRWERFVDGESDGDSVRGTAAAGGGSEAGDATEAVAGVKSKAGAGSSDPTGAAAVMAAGYVRGNRADGSLCWVPADEYGAF